MKIALSLTLSLLRVLTGCTGGGFATAKYTPEQLAAADDASLANHYADANSRGGANSEAAKRLKAELQTREFPRDWEWAHIDRGEVVPGMTASGVNCIFGFSGRGDFLSCNVTEEGYEEGYQYRRGFKTVSIWMRNGTVSTVIDGGRVQSIDQVNTRRADAPLVQSGR